ncbi:MAG: hypothetical protein AB3N20_17840 [Rhizobiaceae bacterium]
MALADDHKQALADGQPNIARWLLANPIVKAILGSVLAAPVLNKLAALMMVLVVAGTAGYAVVRPDYNWDMVAYVATALENRIGDADQLHAQTWAEITPGATEAQLYHLQQSNPYNLHQWENPVDFQSQLSMYRVKIGYIALIRGLEPVFGLTMASMLLSIVPAVGIGLLCLYWLWYRQSLQAAFVAVPLLIMADFTHMTTAVGPDMLASLVSLVAIMLLMMKRELPAYVLLFASVLVRPDNIILFFALLIAATLFRWRFLPMLVTFLASFAAGIYIQNIGGHPGWWAHFYFSCVRIQHTMIGFAPDFAMFDFAKGYVRGIAVSLMDNDWPGILMVLTVGWALLAKAGKMTARGNAIAFALVIGTLGKFVSFPLPDDRFYFVFVAGLIVVLAAEWRPDLSLDRKQAAQI